MNENRRQVLQMLADGKITAEEADRLIAALEKEQSMPATASPSDGTRHKYLRVLIEAQDKFRANSPTKVNIRVPMQLLRAGVRLSSLIPPEARDRANAAMREKGVNFDLGQLKPENLDALLEQLNDLQVDMDDDRTRVRIFCE
jgi:hypothetical protein